MAKKQNSKIQNKQKDSDKMVHRRELSREPINVCIVGGGNLAHTSAGVLAENGHNVNVLTRRPNEWNKVIEVDTKGSSWEAKGTLYGRLSVITDLPSEALYRVKVVILATPSHIYPEMLEKIAPYVEEGAFIGCIYGAGGFQWACEKYLGSRIQQQNLTLFGMFNVPFICKVTRYGEVTRVVGPKKNLYIASYPIKKFDEIAELLVRLYTIPCVQIPNFLTLTLSPSNQIIHPGRYYGIFKDWDGKTPYNPEDLPKTLYEDMDDFSANEMQLLDNELQSIKKALVKRFPALDLDNVIPLGERVIKQYGSDVSDTSSLKQIFRTNLGYATVPVPVQKVPGGVQPAVKSRLFWEDVPYGLCILRNMADMLDLQVPNVNKQIEWHQKFMGVQFLKDGKLNMEVMNTTGTPIRYGMNTIEEVIKTSIDNEAPTAKL
eukprot:CAMPEP_0115006692 /NCGR_PEP_ID=MMETSP0216-20121206/20666_1 /TAXON_ID=223996 /ORGANISM="Protocruzia adherens, Strain Boccale" /LENGTH=431 /DNA_ID=CAMNT_0002373353 /DNA_START=13 /DNA_END=1308 /DNA_ORIENTATION=+